MKIAVLGTGMVGRLIAARLAGVGHDVVIGTRDVQATLSRTESGPMGTPPFGAWATEHPDIPLVTLAQAGEHGELVVNATTGEGSQPALAAIGAERLAGRVVLDIANPLDFSAGFPPTLSVVNTDSLAEQLQRAFPAARVVKSLNTMNAELMVDPSRLSGAHSVFVAGDDAEAKATVSGLLGQFGWPAESIIDLGPLRSARGTEMFLPLWLSLMQSLGTSEFNINVVTA